MKIFELKKDIVAPIHPEYGLHFSKDVCNISYLMLNTNPLSKTVELGVVVVSKSTKEVLHYLLRKTFSVSDIVNYFNVDGTLTEAGITWGFSIPYGNETLADYVTVVDIE